jgi:hypothetical protein
VEKYEDPITVIRKGRAVNTHVKVTRNVGRRKRTRNVANASHLRPAPDTAYYRQDGRTRTVSRTVNAAVIQPKILVSAERQQCAAIQHLFISIAHPEQQNGSSVPTKTARIVTGAETIRRRSYKLWFGINRNL